MTARGWVALVLLAIILAICLGCALHVQFCLDPLLLQAEELEALLLRDPPSALEPARQWYVRFEQAVRALPFYVSHDAVEQAAQNAEVFVTLLAQERPALALEHLLLCRQQLQHIRDWEQCFPENVL